MSNVHGIGSFNRQRDELPGPGPGRINPSHNPQDMTFIEFICPGFKLKSSIIIISIIQVAVFIATLVVGFGPGLRPTGASLLLFGAAFGPLVAAGEVWRLLCPIFLHADPFHILFNVYFQIRMGLPTEARYGIRRFIAVYFLSGVIGNIFSTCVAPCAIKVGASTSGFGLIGIQLAETMLEWHRLTNKEQVVMNLLFFLLMVVMFSFGIPHLDIFGHLGGCLAGLALGILINENMEGKPEWYNRGRAFALTGLVALALGCLIKIFVATNCFS